uniref:BHLH domain-containing protein n=2 Tax=Chenopodium quinoa TaxID=63459 RepID=A0A803MN21_CHEQI
MGFTNFVENIHHPTTTDLLTLLHLPISSFATAPSSFGIGKLPSSPPPPSAFGFLGEFNPAMMVDYPVHAAGSGSSYDPNLFPQNSAFMMRDQLLFHPNHEYSTGNLNGIDGVYQEEDTQFLGNGILEFRKGKGKVGNNNKSPKNSATEKQRRRNFNDKYDYLSKLIPNQTKTDRASIVLDAINHIHELRRTVGELKILVDKKRISKMKRHKTHEDTNTNIPVGGDQHGTGVDGVAVVKPEPEEDLNVSTAIQLRSSWIQRKWKDSEVDVRIVDDDVTIKLVQRKKINCLLSVSRTLDELQLDLRHVAGGEVGDYYSYLFNTKICEGSSVYASAIANKLIEVVERESGAASVVD